MVKKGGRFVRFVAKTLALVSPVLMFGCQEPKIDMLPQNPAQQICATTNLCVPGITQLLNGSLNSRIDPTKIDQDSAGNWISSNTVILKFKEGTGRYSKKTG